MTPLFRPEALDGQRQSWLGGIQLIRPLPLSLLAAFSMAVAALTLGYGFVGEYTRKAHLSGVLVPDSGLVRLMPPQEAAVLYVHAREGQTVQQGDLLFVLEVARAAQRGESQGAGLQDPLAGEPGAAASAPEAGVFTRQRIPIRAPQGGLLTAVHATPGQRVSPTSSLASIAPAHARLQAELYAPVGAIGFLRPQQAVQLRYEALPHPQFGPYSGRVLQVSRAPMAGSELAALSPATKEAGAGAAGLTGGPNAAEPLYRITVALDQQSVAAYGQAQALSPGMQLEADVLLDRRRLIEWLFEPVLGIAGRV